MIKNLHHKLKRDILKIKNNNKDNNNRIDQNHIFINFDVKILLIGVFLGKFIKPGTDLGSESEHWSTYLFSGIQTFKKVYNV